jgi:hypothetical protein
MTMDKRFYEEVRYVFTDEEIRHLGESLARESQDLIDLREQRSSAAAAFAAQIKESGIRSADLAMKINNKYEMREVEVVPLMDTPRPGMKAIVRIENPDDVIRYEPMTSAEKQESFGFHISDEGEQV